MQCSVLSLFCRCCTLNAMKRSPPGTTKSSEPYRPHFRVSESSDKSFCADLPNETWQADVTHVTVANGEVFEGLNIMDDHSRLRVASHAFVTTRSSDVVRTFCRQRPNTDPLPSVEN